LRRRQIAVKNFDVLPAQKLDQRARNFDSFRLPIFLSRCFKQCSRAAADIEKAVVTSVFFKRTHNFGKPLFDKIGIAKLLSS
jgi:hypothetical protein